MSMDKAIEHNKEHRKQYRGSKAISKHCRNNGSCEWCVESRLHKNLKKMQKSVDKEFLEWYNEEKDLKER